MYRIDTEKLSAFKEATLALRQRIEETKEECTVQTDSISQAWEGDAAEAATQTGQELVTRLTGEAETLCGLEAVLEDALEKSHMLLNQSRKFASILEEGEESRLVYTGYREIGNTSACEGIIMLDESTVADVVSGCNRTAEYAREIEAITYEIDGIMNSLEYAHIDISAQTARIRKGCKRVERIEEYGRSYGRYAEEFMELDRNLSKALAHYRSEEYTGLTERDKRGYDYNVNKEQQYENQYTISVEDEIRKAILSDNSIPVDQKGIAIIQRIRFYQALCILKSGNATFGYIMNYDYNNVDYLKMIEVAREVSEGNVNYIVPIEVRNGWLHLYDTRTVITANYVARQVDLVTSGKEHKWCNHEYPYKEETAYINPYAYQQMCIAGMNVESIEVERNFLVNEEGRYWVAVGPRILIPDYSCEEDVNATDFVYGTKLDIEVYDPETGQTFYIPVVVGDVKNHTYPNGMYHTGVPYPNSVDKTTAAADYSYIEFIRTNKDENSPFADLNLIIKGVIVYEKAN